MDWKWGVVDKVNLLFLRSYQSGNKQKSSFQGNVHTEMNTLIENVEMSIREMGGVKGNVKNVF